MSTALPVNADIKNLIDSYAPTEPLGFGVQLAPIMIQAEYRDGKWGELEVVPFGPLSLSPATKALHYGQEIFEGMKAYKGPDGTPLLFRPEVHAKRFEDSAERMSMPILPSELFLEAVKNMAHHMAPHIPNGPGESLYLRPFMLATGEGISLAPSPTFLFIVIASPSGGYFAASEVNALIERTDRRAFPGGTGNVKVAGNYGASFRSSYKAKELGYQQTLWLDAIEGKYVEEFSGMNMYALIDGKLYTPELTSSILPGITRSAILEISRDLGIETIEAQIKVDELVGKIKDGSCQEIFTCGTAAVITPITALGEKDGTKYPLPKLNEPLWSNIREKLVAIQEGRLDNKWDWSVRVELG